MWFPWFNPSISHFIPVYSHSIRCNAFFFPVQNMLIFSLNHLCDWWCELSVCISVCTLTSLELLLEGQIKYFDLK